MVLVNLILILLLGGVVAAVSERASSAMPRMVALSVIVLAFFYLILHLSGLNGLNQLQSSTLDDPSSWLIHFKTSWIPAFGINIEFALDGLSLLMVLLTLVLGAIAVSASWTDITERHGFFEANLLWTIAGVLGVFMAMDLFLFFLFWEVMLIPMYFLIAIWGHENRGYAAMKFFIFTQASGLLMLVATLALVAVYRDSMGHYSFSYFDLLNTPMAKNTAWWLMLGFFVAFVVKLPGFPFHTWLPDAHGEANAPVSMLLAGVLLKMGGYALLRFNVQMLPEAHATLAPALVILGIVNIVYGALNAFAQDNVKRRIACSSVSHMGFVLVGIGAVDALGISGAMLQMVSHGLIAAAMFFVTGVFYERTKTLSIPNMGGLAKALPITFAFFLASSLASLALPGMSGFISEITVFLGITSQEAFTSVFRSITVLLAAIGLVLTPIYLLSMCRRVFFGPRIPALASVADMRPRELVIGLSLLVPTLVIGIWPRIAMDLYEASTNALALQFIAS